MRIDGPYQKDKIAWPVNILIHMRLLLIKAGFGRCPMHHALKLWLTEHDKSL